MLAPGFMNSVYNDMFYNLKSLKRASDHELCHGICRALRDVSESIFFGGEGGIWRGHEIILAHMGGSLNIFSDNG